MTADAHYILGHDDTERDRLRAQATFLEPLSRRWLDDAGVRPGQHVLDVGAGFGDVSLLAASIVGPTGRVVGVEREPAAVTQATARAVAQRAATVSFVEGDLRDVRLDDPFDAAIGRFVLMYLACPVEAIAAVADHVRPGGVVTFLEWHPADRPLAEPAVGLWSWALDVLVETFRRAGTNDAMGLQLRQSFIAAGLPSPQLRMERLVGGGPDFAGYGFLTGLLRSTLPMIEQYGVTSAAELDVETLEHRLRLAVVAADATVALPSIVAAWAVRP